MKRVSALIFCFVAIVFLGGGCKLLDELNKPKLKRTKQVCNPESYEPTTFPDGTTAGLNKYEMEYIKNIDQDFKRQQQINARRVFGGSGP